MSAEQSERPLDWGHERIHVVHDHDSGLRAVIAIHSTVLGPALGGLRICRYPGGLAEGLDDALRLSRAMTLKAAAAGLDLGGGKAVIVDDGDCDGAVRTARLTAFAREVERLGGAYITAEDVGTTTDDMDLIGEHTTHVVGRTAHDGTGGDPSPATAQTVFEGIRSALWALDGDDALAGRRVGVLGLGKVGGVLARTLAQEGAEVVGFDPVRPAPEGVERAASEQELLAREFDVLAPCALGGLVDERLAEALRVRAVCGAANNPLTGPAAARTLAAREILYVPDFLANCGGLIHVDAERRATGADDLERGIAQAGERMRAVLVEAREQGRLPFEVAEAHAWERVERARAGAAAPAAAA
ncbi:Glu/Leu/Phe/Val dehydrogenase [Conexibacter arvalis]|uniref:Glutamate dehydrogenase/leucine dehydrogenase n=1 Tax=Conexibacter arvalis TaxID=912552 RepID=A0A840IJC4_9ACTN|nr:Glu/Leu/Phe/Val dehydrogenase [Conexibacter arvalis]MBB4665122.1 glutamate dehydrogenase/leucine dehydrogenase [Conexibacter arvalis]